MVNAYEYLENLGVHVHSINIINEWENDKIKQVGKDLYDLLPSPEYDNSTLFDFSSNSELSGEPTPCHHLECRLKRIDKLSRFAVLYANKVVFINPFDEYNSEAENYYDNYKEEFKSKIMILFYIRPLVESEIIKFGNRKFHFCSDCYEKLVLNNGFSNKLEAVDKYLVDLLCDKISFTYVKYKDNVHYIEIGGSRSLINSEVAALRIDKRLYNDIDKKVKLNNHKKFTTEEVKEFGLVQQLTSDILDDILMQNVYSDIYGTQYLTSKEIDIKILNTVNSPDINIYNDHLIDAFQHSVPFVYDIELSKLVELREKQGESFVVYRDAMKEAIDKTKNINNLKEMTEVFDNIVRPELNSIDLTIKNSKKILTNKLGRDVLIGLGAIVMAATNGIMPNSITTLIATAGGVGSVIDILSQGKNMFKIDENIKNNKYYFLWDVKNHAYKV